MARILIIENDRDWQSIASEGLNGHKVEFSPTLHDAYGRLEKEAFDVVVASLESNQVDNIQALKEKAPYTPLIVVSERDKTDVVVQVIRAGAFDFISKPYSTNRMRIAVSQALDQRAMRNEIDYLRRTQDITYDFDKIIAVSPAMKKVINTLKRIADLEATILMTGQTGTGKSILSGTIHFNSRRRAKPFIKINCANIPETLLESELFGHERGAFTGATKTRIGRMEQANGGTVFLDEIGELPPALQAKLLRVLEEKCFERLGGNQTIRSDIRIIAATHRDLEASVEAGNFREDLYYRINVLRVHLPPLSERHDCIEPLANFLLDKIGRDLGRQFDGFSPEVLTLFKGYHWPGNIRELSNAIERAVLLEDSRFIRRESITLYGMGRRVNTPPPPKDLETGEKDMLLEALELSDWVQKDAADRLGVTPRKLNYMVRKHGITHNRWRKNK
ncbi:MAG: sigma-54 dependent transcriptional regulator [Syntrophobacteraceae bacterium]